MALQYATSYVLAVVSKFATIAFLLSGVIGAGIDSIAFLARRHFATAIFGGLYGFRFGVYMIGAGAGRP